MIIFYIAPLESNPRTNVKI